MIPFKKVNLGNSLELLRPYIESGNIGLGDAVFEFEKELAKYVGSKYVVALNSCTSALFLALKYEELKGHKKVIIPSMTVPHTLNAVLQAGMEVELNDNVSWVGGRYLIKGTDVIDSAHELRRFCFKGLPPESKLCFSFYPTKTVGSADGGAIATNDKDFVDWLRSTASYGRDQKQTQASSWNYEIINEGYKCNWNNLQAVIALEQLKRLDQTNKRRKEIAVKYRDFINRQIELISIPSQDSDYLFRLNVKFRNTFIQYMLRNGVECGVHFKPLHLMKPFRHLKVESPHEIEAEYAYTVSLPFYDLLTDEEVDIIIRLINDWPKSPDLPIRENYDRFS